MFLLGTAMLTISVNVHIYCLLGLIEERYMMIKTSILAFLLLLLRFLVIFIIATITLGLITSLSIK